MNEPGCGPVGGCLIIANPAAGGVTEELVSQVRDICLDAGATARVGWTAGRGEAAAMAARAGGMDVVVAVGGDGTTLEVVTGLVRGHPIGTGPCLFVVPGGTGNSNYRAHWDELPWPAALRTALRDSRASSRLDLAVAVELDELVVLGAGAGLTAEVLRSARDLPLRGRQRLSSGLAHAASRFRPFPSRVTVDGATVHEGPTTLVNVGGGRYRAWQYLVLPDSVLDDGLLDVCVVGADAAPHEVPELLRTGRHVDLPGTVYRRGASVTIERTDGSPLCIEHDGELVEAEHTRVTIDVLPGALNALRAPLDAATAPS